MKINVFGNLPMYINLSDALGGYNFESHIGWATATRETKTGETTIEIKLSPASSEILGDMARIFDLKGIGFAGVKRPEPVDLAQAEKVMPEKRLPQKYLDAAVEITGAKVKEIEARDLVLGQEFYYSGTLWTIDVVGDSGIVAVCPGRPHLTFYDPVVLHEGHAPRDAPTWGATVTVDNT